jgi:hypothetical protein
MLYLIQFLLVFLEHEDLSIVTLNLDVRIFYVLECGLQALNFFIFFGFCLTIVCVQIQKAPKVTLVSLEGLILPLEGYYSSSFFWNPFLNC